jgi:hypothetical protein
MERCVVSGAVKIKPDDTVKVGDKKAAAPYRQSFCKAEKWLRFGRKLRRGTINDEKLD